MRAVPIHVVRCMLALIFSVLATAATAERAVVLEVDGAIGPALADYIGRALREVNRADTRVVILRMNTPGGLDSSMREIIRAMLAAPVPVITFVAPSGARAASAGTYIAYASAIAAMAPGTNLGAATPIRIGGLPGLPGTPEQPSGQKGQDKEKSQDKSESTAREPPDTETRKAVNDASAYIRGLAELHGRNADWAVEAVRNSVSIPASEALKLHVIDVIADDVPDLLRQIDGRTALVAGKSERLATSGLAVLTLAPDWRTELLAVITNPNVAFILMLLGIYGLIFEFLNPGMVAPGVVGGISLLVGLFALNMLPINYAGAALVLLGIGLMVAEAHVGAFGILGVGGIVAFVVGAIMMFPPGAPGFDLSLGIVAAAAVASALFVLLTVVLFLRSRQRPVATGSETLIGAEGEVLDWQTDEGRVRVNGDIWRARAAGPLTAGVRVKVIERHGLVLKVKPA